MNNRDRFFNILTGGQIDRTPFFPDIASWYVYTRQPFGTEAAFGPGDYIPDDSAFNKKESRLKGKAAKMTFLDFYRTHDWGLPVHLYKWRNTEYLNGIEVMEKKTGEFKSRTYKTPRGDLQKTWQLAGDGSWAPQQHLIKELKDIEIYKYLAENCREIPDETAVLEFYGDTEGFGVCDTVINRSPFGKLVHELMGFERVVYELYDNEKVIHDLLSFQEYLDLALIEKAADYPAKIVCISDHADENLISPAYYRKYCIPFYQKACAILHKKGKFVSTHLDGNFKGFFPVIRETHFDLLDGCTPAPMFNYEVEELAAAAGKDLRCYCGVPSTLFTQNLPEHEITAFARRIMKAFSKRVILNVGDVLPPDGDIDLVIAAGRTTMAG
ncbi:MAG: uroporphyrinogen decarboxylase family protein [Kiritimatiellae bacterium]|nr:uroporphyrinogen decarboxylase family protein [Kiritimatiellia bacterium]